MSFKERIAWLIFDMVTLASYEDVVERWNKNKKTADLNTPETKE